MKTLPIKPAMARFAARTDPVLHCRCGRPIAPGEMHWIRNGLGNAALMQVGCPVCYWATIGPYGGPAS